MKQNCSGIVEYDDSSVAEGVCFSANDILLANIRPYLKKAWLASFSGICSADVLAIHPNGIDPSFLFSVISRDSFFSYVMSGVKGSKMPRGDKGHIMDYPFAVPSLVEQAKISNLFILLDKRIEVQRRTIDSLKLYKRGVASALFSQRIRLHRPDGSAYEPWTPVHLGSVFCERTERATGNEMLLAVTIHNGVQNRADLELKDNSSSDKQNYRLVRVGDLAYNTMRMWQGACGVSNYEGIVSPAYTVLHPCDPQLTHTPFWAHFFKQPQMLHVFQRNSQGLTSDTWNLKYDKFSRIVVSAPSVDEQIHISRVLNALSAAIQIQEDILNLLHNAKRGLLAVMFI